jgi:hypothetical protein
MQATITSAGQSENIPAAVRESAPERGIVNPLFQGCGSCSPPCLFCDADTPQANPPRMGIVFSQGSPERQAPVSSQSKTIPQIDCARLNRPGATQRPVSFDATNRDRGNHTASPRSLQGPTSTSASAGIRRDQGYHGNGLHDAGAELGASPSGQRWTPAIRKRALRAERKVEQQSPECRAKNKG